jgi:hypothetical protein
VREQKNIPAGSVRDQAKFVRNALELGLCALHIHLSSMDIQKRRYGVEFRESRVVCTEHGKVFVNTVDDSLLSVELYEVHQGMGMTAPLASVELMQIFDKIIDDLDTAFVSVLSNQFRD